MDIKQYIKIQEGEVKENGVHKTYRCPSGALTIGWGHNLDSNGITDGIANLLLDQDLENARESARRVVPGFDELNPARQCVVISMIIQMGESRFKRFKKTIAYLENENWHMASIEMCNSKWYRDLKQWAGGGWTRADRESQMMSTGDWA